MFPVLKNLQVIIVVGFYFLPVYRERIKGGGEINCHSEPCAEPCPEFISGSFQYYFRISFFAFFLPLSKGGIKGD